MKKKVNTKENFLDYSLPLEVRVKDLVSKMTLEEKITQLMNISPALERLHIQNYDWRNECLQGVAFRGKSTIFPQAIAMAATWNPSLIYEIATAISDEARAKHHDFARRNERGRWQGITFSCPSINIFRDPRWGRGQETFGEDPYLTSRIGVAFVKGLQGNHSKYIKAAAEAKHFAVHSGPENVRHEINNIVDKKDLYETYLPAFKACIQEAKAEGIMSAYSRLNGEACCASKTMMNILRNELGFEGYFIGDGGAVTDIFKNHKMVSTLEEAVVMAINAGCDIINPMDITTLAKIKRYRRAIQNGISTGLIKEKTIDNNLTRILKARFKLGMFDPPELVPYTNIPYSVVNCEKHQDLALKAARESIVLLKNENNLLPLSNNLESIAVMGPNANNPKSLYYHHYYPDPESRFITPLQGIKKKVSSKTTIYHAQGCDLTEATSADFAQAIGVAKKADIVVMVLGITGDIEGEEGYVLGPTRGDREDLNLPHVQEVLMEKIINLNKPIVLILTSGSALSVNLAKDNIPAIIHAWYPGEKGGYALADILLGDYNPAGRLPITFYKSIEQLPDFKDYGMKNRTYRYFKGEPLFPFGYGLSYTRFEYTNLKIYPKTPYSNQSVQIRVDVKNVGSLPGDEVIQVYISHSFVESRVPIRELKGFKRIHLTLSEIKTVSFTLSPSQFAIINDKGESIIEKGEISVYVGGGQPGFDKDEIGLSGVFEVI